MPKIRQEILAYKEITATKSIPDAGIPGYSLALIFTIIAITSIVLVSSTATKRKTKNKISQSWISKS